MYYIKVKTFLSLSGQSVYISIYTLYKDIYFFAEKEISLYYFYTIYTTYTILAKSAVLYFDSNIIIISFQIV